MGLPDEGERKNTKENKKMIHKIDNTIEEKYIELANKRVADIHAGMLHAGLYDILGCKTIDDYADELGDAVYNDKNVAPEFSGWYREMIISNAIRHALEDIFPA